MADMGYADVSTDCPVGACAGVNIIRIFGMNGSSYYRTVKCATCGEFYGVKVVMSVSGTPTEYDLTPDA